MRPLHLTVSGFTSFKDEVELSFENLDLFVISGATGAGKSSLLDAMTYALFGEVARTGKQGVREMISQGRDRVSVMFDFRARGDTWRVTRARRRTSANQAILERRSGDTFVPVTDQVRNVDTEVERLIGLEFEAFKQAVLLPQGKFASFLQSDDSKRRTMLNRLLGLEIYERMRKRAAANESFLGSRKDDLERRLSEDYAGVTPEALVGLESSREALAQQLTESAEQLRHADQQFDRLRRDHERTTELAAKEAAIASLDVCQPLIDDAILQLEAAHRAADVIPYLDQEGNARRDQQKVANELEQTEDEHRILDQQYLEARQELTAAEEAAAAIPQLQTLQTRLTEVLGKLSHRDQLNEQIASHDKSIHTREQQHSRLEERCREFTTSIALLDDQHRTAREAVAALGYDRDRAQRLHALRDRAVRLQSDRVRLATDEQEHHELRGDAALAEESAIAAVRKRDESQQAREQAELVHLAAREACERARASHAAAHLRSGLSAGDSCPVCRSEITARPNAEQLPVLEELERALKRAEKAEKTASSTAGKHAAEAESTTALASRAQSQADEMLASCESAKGAIARLSEDLRNGSAGEFADDDRPIEDRILAELMSIERLASEHERAESEARALAQRLEIQRLQSETAAQNLVTSSDALKAAGEDRTRIVRLREELDAEIRAVTSSPDPRADRDLALAEIDRLAAARAAAARRESHAARQREATGGRLEQLHRNVAAANAGLALAESRARQALQAGGFESPEAARRVALPPSRRDDLQGEITRHQQSRHSLHQRILELTRDLDGRRVSDEALLNATNDRNARRTHHDETQAQHASLAAAAATLKEKLMRVGHLRSELDGHRRTHRVYHRLAADLQSDHFQAYLLEEMLGSLVRGASQQLARLTDGRHGLDYRDDQIVVVDRDNAGETRSTDTLSGGETFLASLALALELSAQVQQAAGAIQLDCLFIDEGFGTLDPETLRIVTDAIRTLQVGGRVVGIITHIPELKDEFDQRILVTKATGTSRIEVVTN